MVTAAFILAEGLGDLGDVLFIVVVVVLVLIGKLFQKNAEQRQEKEDEQRAGEDRETISRRRPDTAAEPPAAPAPAPAARETTEGPPDSRHLREMERAKVGQALASRRIKGARVSSRKKPGRLGEVDGQTTQDAVRGIRNVDLSRRSQARQAMVYHEIFSPPKALRSGKEMWDR